MNIKSNILNIIGNDGSISDRIIEDHNELLEIVQFLRNNGKKIVYTMGAYDINHVGHERYMQRAKECGDILIVGVDSDEFIRITKGEGRPVVPYSERAESVAHTRYVNIVTILRTREEADKLMHDMRPEVVVLSFSSAKKNITEYEEEMKQKYGPFCDEVKIFERQAETSTTARIRLVIIDGSKKFIDTVKSCTDTLSNAINDFFKSLGGES